MKSDRIRKLLLEQLKKVPILSVACEKVGIARSTVYRWKEQNKKFAKAMEKSITEGEALINDMGESQLITLMKEKNFGAVRFWLNHRHDKFRDRVEVTAKFAKQDELTKEQKEVVREALKLASLDNHNSKVSKDLNINDSQTYEQDTTKQSGENPDQK